MIMIDLAETLISYHVETKKRPLGYSWALIRTDRVDFWESGQEQIVETGWTWSKRGAVAEGHIAAFHDRLDRKNIFPV